MRYGLVVVTLLAGLLAACDRKASPPPAGAGAGPRPAVRIGYVLHGLNDFTQVIRTGAEDAGRTLGVDVEVTGPPGFTATEAMGMFEGMVQKRKNGLVVVPQPGEIWVRPIQEAVDAGIPVVTANVTSPGSAAAAWFGQDERGSGVILARELKKALKAAGKSGGRVIVGICAPAEAVLKARYDGFKEGMAGSGFEITEAFDVTLENTSNYSTWENLASANREMVAAVGLCSMDIPNLAKVKERAGGHWLIAGYDLNLETLAAIKNGTAQVALGQHPYLQGYLPVLAIVRHLRDRQPLVRGWVDVGTEIITRDNVASVEQREADPATESRWYATYIAEHFDNLGAVAKPLPGGG